jgi:lactoylglutathione lyase
MSSPIPVRGLFETHLTVSDLARSVGFYRDVVGLELAYELPERSLGSAPMGLTLHVAFEVALSDLHQAPERLAARGVTPLSFFGAETTEPNVIGWMPAAAVSFRDPDGHLIEYLSMLDEEPEPGRGIVPWSEWSTRSPRG